MFWDYTRCCCLKQPQGGGGVTEIIEAESDLDLSNNYFLSVKHIGTYLRRFALPEWKFWPYSIHPNTW